MSPVETPSFVLRQFRRVMFPGKNQIAFGMAVGWGADVQRRLEEEGGTLFTKYHLDQLVEQKLLSVDSPWYRRFETAMVGEDWPPTVTAEVKDGQVVVPIKLPSLQGPTQIVLQLVLGLVLAFGIGAGSMWLRAGYGLGRFPHDKRVTAVPVNPLQVGSEEGCPVYVGVFHTNGAEATGGAFVAGETIEVGALAYRDCFVASRFLVEGRLIGWSDNKEAFDFDPNDPGLHLVGYRWDTTGLAPGDYQIRVEFIPRFWRLARAEVLERTITLE